MAWATMWSGVTAARATLGWVAVVCGPPLLIALAATNFVPLPVFDTPDTRFVVKFATALLSLALAAVLALAASEVHEAQVVLLAMAFVGIAGVSLIRAVTTPGELVIARPAWFQKLDDSALFPGVLLLTLSSLKLSPRVQRSIVARPTLILGLFVAAVTVFGVVAFVSSAGVVSEPAVGAGGNPTVATADLLPDVTPELSRGPGLRTVHRNQFGPPGHLSTPSVSWVVPAATLLLLGLAVWRYVLMYRRSRSPQCTGFLVSTVFLVQAQLTTIAGRFVPLVWWKFHVLVLAALLAALVGLGVEYSTKDGLRGMVEGLYLRETIAQLQMGYADAIVALVGAVEAKDPYTRGHSHRVAAMSYEIAQELYLPQERARTIHQAAILHDIGKIGVPDAILNKTEALTEDEFAAIREHPVRGHEIIRDIRSLGGEIAGVRWHHERLDGSGYPDGLVGDAIPLDARIIAVADVYDALTSNRSYRTAFGVERALTIVREEAGTRLDWECVQALLRVVARPAPFPRGVNSSG